MIFSNNQAKLLWRKVTCIVIALIIASTTACSHTTQHLDKTNTTQLQQVLSGAALLGKEANKLTLPDDNVFAITPGMKIFVDRYVPKKASNIKKVEHLQRALLLGMKYDAHKTYTAKETFELGRSNCLGFTLLFYSLAKYIGLKVHINEVDIPPSWNLADNEIFVLFRHVNAKINLSNGKTAIIDLDIQTYDEAYKQRNVDVTTARAQFYNNRGMELMMAGDIKNAFRYLRKSIDITPDLDYVWNNLGVLYSRNGHHLESETAYLKALSIAPTSLTTLGNIGDLYRRIGKHEKAQHYIKQVKYHRLKNPYYHFSIAKKAFENKQLETALASIKKAIEYEKKDMRFYNLSANIYRELNQPEKAKNILARGEKKLRIDKQASL